MTCCAQAEAGGTVIGVSAIFTPMAELITRAGVVEGLAAQMTKFSEVRLARHVWGQCVAVMFGGHVWR